MHILNFKFKFILGCVLFLFLPSNNVFAQVIFQESFNEANGAMFGIDNIGGASWSSYCNTCLTGDYFNVQNGELVGNDTNGEAGWETGIVSISGCQNIEITFTVKENGSMEGCGTGCNSVDWISLEYNIDGNGYQPAPNSFFCAGACANTNVIYADDLPSGTASYSSGCLGSGSTLQFRIKVQCWAQDEFWIVDDIAVNCVGTAVTLDPVPTMCETDAPIQLTASSGSGTWSGPGVSSSGIFDPTVAGPGSHPIFYDYGSGSCAGQTSMSIMVTAAPTIGVVSAAATSFCGSGSTNLSLTSASGAIQWQSASSSTGPFSDIPGATTLVLATGNLTSSTCYRATVSGCGTPVVSNVVCIDVNPLPLVNAGPDQSTCLGQNIILSGSGAINYSWSNGISNNTAFTPTLGTTNYTVTGTNAFGCINTDQVAVTVNALPIVFAGNDQTICQGTGIILSGAGAVTYSWTNGVIDGQSFIPGTTTTYTVTGTDANACENTDNVTITLTNSPVLPTLPVISVPCPSNIPPADVAVITNFLDDFVSNPIVSFLGDVSNGAVCNSEEIIRTYEVILECGAPQLFTQTIAISAQTPTIDAGTDVLTCEGGTVAITATPSDPTAIISWDQGIQQGVPFTPLVGTQIYTVSASLCAGACIGTDEVAVTVEEALIPTFTVDTAIICEGGTIVFESTTNNSIDCLWDFGNGLTSTSCSGEAVLFPNSGLFDVSLTVQNAAGCISTLNISDFIAVLPNPIASFGSSTSVISQVNSEVHFYNNSVNSDEYFWDFGDGTTSTLEELSHEFSLDGGTPYTVTLVASNAIGCVDTSTMIIQMEESLIYYIPNTFTPDEDPFNPIFLPIFNETVDGYNYQLLIFDRWGEVVFESRSLQEGWDGTYDGKAVPDGTYIWKINVKMMNNDDIIELRGHVNLLR